MNKGWAGCQTDGSFGKYDDGSVGGVVRGRSIVDGWKRGFWTGSAVVDVDGVEGVESSSSMASDPSVSASKSGVAVDGVVGPVVGVD